MKSGHDRHHHSNITTNKRELKHGKHDRKNLPPARPRAPPARARSRSASRPPPASSRKHYLDQESKISPNRSRRPDRITDRVEERGIPESAEKRGAVFWKGEGKGKEEWRAEEETKEAVAARLRRVAPPGVADRQGAGCEQTLLHIVSLSLLAARIPGWPPPPSQILSLYSDIFTLSLALCYRCYLHLPTPKDSGSLGNMSAI